MNRKLVLDRYPKNRQTDRDTRRRIQSLLAARVSLFPRITEDEKPTVQMIQANRLIVSRQGGQRVAGDHRDKVG
jgi:hypothetical protein